MISLQTPARKKSESLGDYYERLLNSGLDTLGISNLLSRPEQNIKWVLSKRKQRQAALNGEIPDPLTLNTDQPLHIESKSAIVTCDWHIPGHNKVMLERLCAIARKEAIEDLFVIGDLYDFPSLNRFSHNQNEVTANQVVRIAGAVMKPVFNIFKRVIICSGNHDEHFSRAVDDTFDLELLIDASLGRKWVSDTDIKVSNLDYIYLNDSWIVGHPSNYSGQGGKTPSDYADLYQRNVVTGHNHIVGYAQSKSGNYIGIDTGAMLTPDAHYYQKRRMNKYTRWQNGFTVIKNDYAKLYTENFTDWKAEGIA